jgi:hypothetical protein
MYPSNVLFSSITLATSSLYSTVQYSFRSLTCVRRSPPRPTTTTTGPRPEQGQRGEARRSAAMAAAVAGDEELESLLRNFHRFSQVSRQHRAAPRHPALATTVPLRLVPPLAAYRSPQVLGIRVDAASRRRRTRAVVAVHP